MNDNILSTKLLRIRGSPFDKVIIALHAVGDDTF